MSVSFLHYERLEKNTSCWKIKPHEPTGLRVCSHARRSCVPGYARRPVDPARRCRRPRGYRGNPPERPTRPCLAPLRARGRGGPRRSNNARRFDCNSLLTDKHIACKTPRYYMSERENKKNVPVAEMLEGGDCICGCYREHI